MSPKKSGSIFIVLMIAFVAFGFGSIADALNLGGDAITTLIPANITNINQQQVTQIGDPTFTPVYLSSHEVVENKTVTPTNTTNVTNQNTG